MTDPISDMLTRIRNGLLARKSSVAVPYSKLKEVIAAILVAEGYLISCEEETNGQKMLRLALRYDDQRQSVIQVIRRISKPGHRVYVRAHENPIVLNDMGVAILSTSLGVMTNKEARKRHLGGEVLCEVY